MSVIQALEKKRPSVYVYFIYNESTRKTCLTDCAYDTLNQQIRSEVLLFEVDLSAKKLFTDISSDLSLQLIRFSKSGDMKQADCFGHKKDGVSG